MSNNKNILILGFGNIILSDDGVGSRIVEDLRGKITYPDITYDTATVGGLEIIELIKDFELVVIIDGIRTIDGKPGDVYFMNAEDYKETLHLSNFHDVDFRTALNYAGKIGVKMPGKITIIAVEIKEDTIFAKELTPALKSKYNDILQLAKNCIHSEIDRWKRLDNVVVQ